MALVGLILSASPVRADSGLVSRQAEVKQQLADASAQISSLSERIDALEAQISDTKQRVERERAQLRLLARAMYAQPSSPLLVLLSAGSLEEALTRLSDLSVAGDRAAATERALEADLASLQRMKSALEASRDRQRALATQLEKEFRQLQAMIDAEAAAPAPAPPPVPVASGPIQQIILDAFAGLGPAAQSWALRVAWCESHYNPYAVNRYSGASGLFQFLPSTWARTPYASRSVFDPVANAQAAAWYYDVTGRTGSPWSCK